MLSLESKHVQQELVGENVFWNDYSDTAITQPRQLVHWPQPNGRWEGEDFLFL